MKDLLIVFILAVLAAAFIIVPPLDETPVRTVLGLLLTLFLPGYALIAMLFPKKKDLSGIERLALSFGLSIAVVPLLGLILNYTPAGIREIPVLLTVTFFTLACTLAAYVRRKRLKEEERFTPAYNWKLVLPKGRLDSALTVILALAILASVAALVYVIVSPKQGEKFTEFYILGPGGMADNYPTKLTAGDNGTVLVGVVNHEYAPVNYTLRIALGEKLLREEALSLVDNQTYLENYTFAAEGNGTEKLEFDLYREGVETPYRSLHLWVETKASS